jgi:uncharacterized protein YlxW (UPF0749 family)
MDPLTGGNAALWAVAISIIGLAFVLIFRTPKEISVEQSKRLDDLEDEHHKLDKAVSALAVEVRHLAESVGRLNQNLQQLNGARISGRHPRSP